MDYGLEIFGLGGVRILQSGAPVAGLSNCKAIALRIYLTSTRRLQPGEVLMVRWSPDGGHLAVFGMDALVSVWRVRQSTEELVEYAKECCIFRELTYA